MLRFRDTQSSLTAWAAFTLVELLVVVAVNAILASLLLPVLGRAKATAASVVCKNNLKQLGVGLNMYVSDFRRYPYAFLAGGPTWSDLLGPYTMAPGNGPGPTNRLFLCPSYRGSKISTHWCYGFNVARNVTAPANPLPLPLSSLLTNATPENAVIAPGDLYAIADARLWSGLNLPSEYDPYGVALIDPYAGPGVVLVEKKVEPHSRGRNIVCCDGHVEVVPRAKLLQRSDAWSRRWYTDHEPHPEQWSQFATP